ncbi:MAG: GNAT family N-acetyltransferase [Pseudomonadota bacterium]
MITIRRLVASDAPLCSDVFFNAVRGATGGPYSGAELAAWAPAPPAGPDWTARISDGIGHIAERDGTAVGFMTTTQRGYIDLAFVLPDERGQGTAAALYDAMLAEISHPRLATHASHFFRPFLERRGWHVVATEHSGRGRHRLMRFEMALDRRDPPLT